MHNNSGVKVILLQSIRYVTIMWKSITINVEIHKPEILWKSINKIPLSSTMPNHIFLVFHHQTTFLVQDLFDTMLLPNHILYQTTLNNIQYQTKPHYVNCIREIVSFEGFKQLVPVWFQNVMYHFSFLLFYIQILNLKKKLKKKKKKTTLVMFGKLF